ncbi:LysR family transcriptional regulator [Novosphingobium sp. RL4]|uniref:LysR family transcriptional regulator n=1 Tax=Novosphingobium sp. RL4 TaxID=3109595 RepID=UPI002D777AE1|nr:LysR family transcriptional regulator [Novosphingobium sp. RL4]WRT95182.1 LysR family transcriptional regulator [Novosphingobium sp. RL4]
MALDLRSLRNMLAVADRRSFTRAAEDLGISQPALTKAIQALETHLGTRLFDRGRSGVIITAQGQQVVERATAIIADIDEFERQTRLAATGQGGRVRFGMAPLPAQALLARALTEQMRSSPQRANEVIVRNVEALWPLLFAGEIEFFVSAEGQVPEAPPVRAVTLGTFPVTLLVRPNHPLLAQKHTDVKFPVLLSNNYGESHQLPQNLPIWANDTIHLVEDYGTLIALTASTDAIWIASRYAVMDEVASGRLCELQAKDNTKRQQFRMVMYSLERRSQSPGALLFEQVFRHEIRTLGATANS